MIELIHRLVAIPWIYDLSQFMAGQAYVHYILKKRAQTLGDHKLVLDVGAGTGLYRTIWSSNHPYICCDIDSQKLAGFTRKFDDPVLQGDGTRLPFRNASVDIVMCIAVAHHLDEAQFGGLVAETARVLKNGGRLLFLEPVYAEKRLPGRFLWALDRGSNPRTTQVLEDALGQHFNLEAVEHPAIYHRYLYAICVKNV